MNACTQHQGNCINVFVLSVDDHIWPELTLSRSVVFAAPCVGRKRRILTCFPKWWLLPLMPHQNILFQIQKSLGFSFLNDQLITRIEHRTGLCPVPYSQANLSVINLSRKLLKMAFYTGTVGNFLNHSWCFWSVPCSVSLQEKFAVLASISPMSCVSVFSPDIIICGLLGSKHHLVIIIM